MSTLFRRATSPTLILTLVFSAGVVRASATEEEGPANPCPAGEQLVMVWCDNHQTHHFICYAAAT